MDKLRKGMRFGRLEVISRDYEKEAILKPRGNAHQQYSCKCDCGNTKTIDVYSLLRHQTTSCGCVKSQDLAGKTFGNLLVTEIDPNYKGKSGKHKTWVCKCTLCGGTKVFRGSDLLSGLKTDCGCMSKWKNGAAHLINLSDKTFGHLKVLHRDLSIGTRSGRHAHWICRCDLCGSTESISSQVLVYYGKDRCSRCIGIPMGEAKISEILLQNNIEFQHDVAYGDCIFNETGGRLRFDFIVNHEDRVYAIEFDGIQHFKPIQPWENKINYNGRKRRDEYKNQWCKENNIPLIRIPYTHLGDLCFDDIQLHTSKFIIS